MRAPAAVLVLAFAACGPHPGLGGVYVFDDPALTSLEPTTLVPGSRIVLAGRAFVPAEVGQSRLRLTGAFEGTPVDVTLPARFVDYERLEVDFGGAAAAGLPAVEGVFTGQAALEIDNQADGLTHVSAPLALTLEVRAQLTPRLDTVQSGLIFVNDEIAVAGDGFLLGGDEGETVAVVEGCFQESGAATCDPVGPTEVVVRPETPFARGRAAFRFDPRIAGIQPGQFSGTVLLRNRHGAAAGAAVRESTALAASYETVRAAVFEVSPAAASLGQYLEVRGGGFVGGDSGPGLAVTTLELTGTFTPGGAPSGSSIQVTLVPEFVAGALVRYVLNEEDELGQSLDLRRVAGTFRGAVRPVVQFGTQTVAGDELPDVTLGIAHVKQVVWLDFLPAYVESLRHFGLRALDQRIRDRVFEVARRDYAGINLEFRAAPPDDFAQYSQVDIGGPDPNGYGLLGYDNTPGKDVENQRLYDKVGGLNATTQEDGYPGYGGVFVESFFGYSQHPGAFAVELESADADFDRIFDPFRPDRGGRPVTAEDLAAGVPVLTTGSGCPAASADRSMQIGCAAWVLGSMIGTTMTHEVGHSLGLADPYGTNFHDPGDLPNRLMDAGGARTFHERAELAGEGPGVFCDAEFSYLRQILPSPDPEPQVTRPPCD